MLKSQSSYTISDKIKFVVVITVLVSLKYNIKSKIFCDDFR